ncbi:unnamed protein product [Prorocentrum cordatum]|uniref:Uncharacterized protein n=1 Tax=Prorocentrum cordatum TaxID=2364126 RepID=A0ABN9WK93_9DINO|nr:unnamed protein product [Polarella glacialis]
MGTHPLLANSQFGGAQRSGADLPAGAPPVQYAQRSAPLEELRVSFLFVGGAASWPLVISPRGVPEPLDLCRVGSLHGFQNRREAVLWRRSGRSKETNLLQAPPHLNLSLKFLWTRVARKLRSVFCLLLFCSVLCTTPAQFCSDWFRPL